MKSGTLLGTSGIVHHSKAKVVVVFTFCLVFLLFLGSTRISQQQVQIYNKNNNSNKGSYDVGSGRHSATSIPELFEQTLVDVLWTPSDGGSSRNAPPIPYFWAIPKTGTRTTLAYLRICLQLAEASHKGASASNSTMVDNIQVLSNGNHRFVNVDVFSAEGINRAVKLHLLSSGLVDFVTTDTLHQTMAKLFLPSFASARLFAVFRHPVEREVSRFYFMQYATWERLYDPTLKEMTLEEFITSQQYDGQPRIYDNWMVRSLTGKISRHFALSDQDLEVAKQVLRRKCLVGLTDKMEESLHRFQLYFHWPLVGIPRKNSSTADTSTIDGYLLSGEQCKQKFLREERKNENPKHPIIEKGTSLWNQLAHIHRYDVELYTYVEYLFDQQESFFSKLSTNF
jgi:hypothetical protein